MWKKHLRKSLVMMLCIMLPAIAGAEVVGTAGMMGEELIHRVIAPNGQEIYFVSLEREPFLTYTDVNFDGMDDLVVCTAQGANNGWFVFYLWDGERYVRATWNEGQGRGLPNYRLFPESGLVEAEVSEGSAGLLHHKWLYRWEGTSLICTRLAEGVTEDGSFVLRVLDETRGALWEWSAYSVDDNTLGALLDEEEEALWTGLR